MRIENVLKFCGKLIHFYNERISFLFYYENGGKEPWTGEPIQPQTLKGSVTGNTDLDNYILSSRVAPDTADANVHAICTSPAVLKMEESEKSSRHFRKKLSNCQRNLQASCK
jgi:hypothetical protein